MSGYVKFYAYHYIPFQMYSTLHAFAWQMPAEFNKQILKLTSTGVKEDICNVYEI